MRLFPPPLPVHPCRDNAPQLLPYRTPGTCQMDGEKKKKKKEMGVVSVKGGETIGDRFFCDFLCFFLCRSYIVHFSSSRARHEIRGSFIRVVKLIFARSRCIITRRYASDARRRDRGAARREGEGRARGGREKRGLSRAMYIAALLNLNIPKRAGHFFFFFVSPIARVSI